MDAPGLSNAYILDGETMNQNEYYIAAVESWQKANRSLKDFALHCYHVSDRQTLALAQDCGCSYETVNNYRNAYTLFVELEGLTLYPVTETWEQAHISLWVKAAQLRKSLNLSIHKTWDYLQTATLANMTRESFAAHVDEKENDTPKWIRRLQSIISRIAPSKDDWKTEMSPAARDRYDRAVAAFVHELEEIAKVEA